MQEPDAQTAEALEKAQTAEVETAELEQGTADTQNLLAQELEEPVHPTETPRKQPNVGKRILFVVLGLVFVGGIAYGTNVVLSMMQPATEDDASTTQTSSSTSQSSVSKQASSEADIKISSSLESIDSGISQEASDQSGADAALSDSDNQITVPTE